MENTAIEWTDHTFNPWIGCTKVHEGCRHCYAETLMDTRYGKVKWGPNGTRVVTSDANWRKPILWNKVAEKAGVRAKVFCASLADIFEDWQGPVLHSGNGDRITHDHKGWEAYPHGPISLQDVRNRLFDLIDKTPWLDWLLLTKRPENIQEMWPGEFRQNVALGTSVSDQPSANGQIPHLRECRSLAPVLFVSYEPALGPVDMHRIPGMASSHKARTLDWWICGGESGANARPMHPDWARTIRDQCQAAGVAFFFKQWGEWAPSSLGGDVAITSEEEKAWRNRKWSQSGVSAETAIRPDTMNLVGKKTAGRMLDGREHNEFPSHKKVPQ